MDDSRSIDFEISFFEKLVREKPDYIDGLIPLAEAYTKKGLYEKGLAIDKRLAALRREDPIVHYNLACSYALLAKKKDAIKALKQSLRLGYNDFDHMKKDPDLKNLHQDPEFQKLLGPPTKSIRKRK